eukprot:GDKI01032129.1.p2 GENE.GDKI01032129.1~~GDKI01032129.1.p2  ORF type:complete len:114 (+),score=20.23 GDKI01032129.1:118-459(+)
MGPHNCVGLHGRKETLSADNITFNAILYSLNLHGDMQPASNAHVAKVKAGGCVCYTRRQQQQHDVTQSAFVMQKRKCNEGTFRGQLLPMPFASKMQHYTDSNVKIQSVRIHTH